MRDFPSVAFTPVDIIPKRAITLDCNVWRARSRMGFAHFDPLMESAAEAGALAVVGPAIDLASNSTASHDLATSTWEVLTRWQRFIMRRNDASREPIFVRALAVHAAMHDMSKPLVVADFYHAIDTWQWLLRLAPNASLELQLAALFHDVERLVSEADERREHHASDYQAFKDAHARGGAVMAREVFARLGLDGKRIAYTCSLLADHERRDGLADEASTDRGLLNDADALSFFSLNSPGYVDYFGLEQARKKISWTIARLAVERLPILAKIRLRLDVEALVLPYLAPRTNASGSIESFNAQG